MNTLLTITWDMSKGLDLGFFTLRFYSLCFALGFVLGYMLMKRIFKNAGIAVDKLDTLLTYVVVATIVGARLGHVFFYQWDYYSQHIDEIFKVWEGGLASHGAVIAIIIAIIIYCKKVLKKSPLWMLDRLVITVALAAALIRVGNLFNSEIYGAMENSTLQTVYTNPPRERIMQNFGNNIEEIDFALQDAELITDTMVYPLYDMTVQFVGDQDLDKEAVQKYVEGRIAPYVNAFSKEEKNILFPPNVEIRWDNDVKNLAHISVMGVPRNPTQIYEALAYFFIFLILLRFFQAGNFADRKGFLFGMFLVLLFGFRFFIEFWKENQVSGEEGMALNIGQYLSIPAVIVGLVFMFLAKNKGEENA